MTALNIVTDADYEPHREIYLRFRGGLETQDGVLDELLNALGMLISEYDTSIRENRFIAGGATERILATAMRCVGIADAQARGLDLNGEDIMVGEHRISVKASFTGGRQAIRLINTLGGAEGTIWQAATIFVLANQGIGYADPALLPNVARSSGDAIILPRKPLDELHEAKPRWLLECKVPAKAQDVSQHRAVSEVVATEILNRTTPTGQAVFPKLRESI